MVQTNAKTTYYLIKGAMLGKREAADNGTRDFLFKDGAWVPDSKHAIADRLIGHDPSEPADSPYKIGNESIMEQIEEVTEWQAEHIMQTP